MNKIQVANGYQFIDGIKETIKTHCDRVNCENCPFDCNDKNDLIGKIEVLLEVEEERFDKIPTSIDVGDRVVITDKEELYTSYKNWVKENVKDKELWLNWMMHDDRPRIDRNYRVIAKAPFSLDDKDDDMLYFIQEDTGFDSARCYLIGEAGIIERKG